MNTTFTSREVKMIKKLPDDIRVAHALEKVRQIDFAPIRFKLGNTAHGEGMSSIDIRIAQLLYEAYLSLLIAFGQQSILAPPVSADKFWHYHILDTRKYMQDCQYLFGEYLHHYPYFGMRGEADESDLRAAGKHTTELMSIHFSNVEGFEDISSILNDSVVSVCLGSCARCKAVSDDYVFSKIEFV
jgi:hypothetical protein